MRPAAKVAVLKTNTNNNDKHNKTQIDLRDETTHRGGKMGVGRWAMVAVQVVVLVAVLVLVLVVVLVLVGGRVCCCRRLRIVLLRSHYDTLL